MWLLISSNLGCCLQDTILVIPPYPYCIEEVPQDVPLEDCWYARPQLLFTCYLRPKHGRAPKNPTYRNGPDDIHKHLVFFSTFEELNCPSVGRWSVLGWPCCMSPPRHLACRGVAVAICTWQAAPGWSVSWGDWWQEGCYSKGTGWARSWDSPASQGW